MRTYTRTDGTPGNQLRFIASVVGIVPTNPKPIGSPAARPAPRPAVPTQYPPHGYQAQPAPYTTDQPPF